MYDYSIRVCYIKLYQPVFSDRLKNLDIRCLQNASIMLEYNNFMHYAKNFFQHSYLTPNTKAILV